MSKTLTIYSNSGHVIETYPPRGEQSEIVLPKFIEPASILVMRDDVIQPFEYFSPTKLEEGNASVTVTKGEKSFSGRILSMDRKNITLIDNTIITTIHNYDIVSYRDVLEKPSIRIPWGNSDVTVSYLVSSIGWICIGTAIITDMMMTLQFTANITNTLEENITANTVLVSGDVYEHRKNQNGTPRNMVMTSMTAPMVTTPSITSSSLEDYVKYNLGDQVIRDKNIISLSTMTIPVTKMYFHNMNIPGVQYGYRFNTPDFIPECDINVYTEPLSYIGSTHISEHQKGDSVDLIIGESTKLQCESSIIVNTVNQPDKSWKVTTNDVTVQITNHHTEIVDLILRYYIGNSRLIDTKCQHYAQRKGGYLEWYFQIPGGNPSKNTFTCQITTGDAQ